MARTLCVLALAVTQVAASQQSTTPTGQTYSWHGELVAVDEAARTLSMKTQIVGSQAKEEVVNFNPGDRVMLTWSGFEDRALHILRASRYDAARKIEESFTFPAEFVSSEAGVPGVQYSTFKIPVPSAGIPALKSLEPGEWVTVTARHQPATEAEVVTAARPFVALPSSTN